MYYPQYPGARSHRKLARTAVLAGLALAVVLAGLLAYTQPAVAATGDLDRTFGNGGKVATAFGNDDQRAKAIAVRADGKIVVAGYASGAGGDYDFAVARYNPDGSPDTSFSGDGKQVTDFGGDSKAFDLALLGGGKVLVVGEASEGGYRNLALARYNDDGTLDRSFGEAGMRTTSPGEALYATAQGVAVDPTGNVTVAGSAYDENTFVSDTVLARYDADGSLDPGFGDGGTLRVDLGNASDDYAYDVALQGENVVVAGAAAFATTDFLLARFDAASGEPDASFGSGGTRATDFGAGYDEALSLTVRDARILVSGSAATASAGDDFALARYDADGDLDPTFHDDGQLTTDFGGHEYALEHVVQPDGKTVAVGESFAADYEFPLARYNADGSLDTTFGNGGRKSTDFGAQREDRASAVALQPDGKIVAAGSTGYYDETTYEAFFDFALARYTVAANVAPVARDLDASTNGTEDYEYIYLDGRDDDGDSLTYTITSLPEDGTLAYYDWNTFEEVRISSPGTTLPADAYGEVIYTPNAGANNDSTAPDTFTYRVNDGTVDSNEGTVSVVIKDELNVTLGDLSQQYSGQRPRPSVTLTDPSGADVSNLEVAFDYYDTVDYYEVDPTNVGSYYVEARVDDPDYYGFGTGDLTVTKAPLTVEADDQRKVYGERNPPFSATYTGFKGNDDARNDLTNAPSFSVSPYTNDEERRPAGTATITPGGASARNYAISYETGTLTIAKRPVEVILTNRTHTYDGDPKSVSVSPGDYDYTRTYKQNGQTVEEPTNAGTYEVTYTINERNYEGSTTTTMTIDKAQASVQLDGLDPTYDGTAQRPTATTSPSGLPVGFSFTDSAGNPVENPTDAGTYAVEANVDDPNYTGSASGTLTIQRAQATVELTDLRHNYTGTAKAARATTSPSGLPVTVSYSQNGQPVASPTQIGTYSVTATVDDPNYAGSRTDTLAIEDSEAPESTVTGPEGLTGNKPTFTFGGSDNAPGGLLFSYSVDGSEYSAYSDATSATLGGIEGLPDGPHTISVRARDAAGNVDASPATKSFRVDATKPNIAATLSSPANAAGWHQDTVTVSLQAADGEGSNVRSVTYRINGGQPVTVTGNAATVNVADEGTTTITYGATDEANNTSAEGSTTVRIDRSAPTGAVSIDNGATKTKKAAVVLTLSADDAPSGVTQMCVANAATGCNSWEPFAASKPWKLSGKKAGTRTVYVTFRDAAGNVSTTVKDTIKYAR